MEAYQTEFRSPHKLLPIEETFEQVFGTEKSSIYQRHWKDSRILFCVERKTNADEKEDYTAHQRCVSEFFSKYGNQSIQLISGADRMEAPYGAGGSHEPRRLYGSQGWWRGTHKKKILVSPSSDPPTIWGHNDVIMWNGDAKGLFQCLQDLSQIPMPTDDRKHFPIEPLPGESAAVCEAELRFYHKKYASAITQKQNDAIQQVIAECGKESSKVPKIFTDIWFKAPRDISHESIIDLVYSQNNQQRPSNNIKPNDPAFREILHFLRSNGYTGTPRSLAFQRNPQNFDEAFLTCDDIRYNTPVNISGNFSERRETSLEKNARQCLGSWDEFLYTNSVESTMQAKESFAKIYPEHRSTLGRIRVREWKSLLNRIPEDERSFDGSEPLREAVRRAVEMQITGKQPFTENGKNNPPAAADIVRLLTGLPPSDVELQAGDTHCGAVYKDIDGPLGRLPDEMRAPAGVQCAVVSKRAGKLPRDTNQVIAFSGNAIGKLLILDALKEIAHPYSINPEVPASDTTPSISDLIREEKGDHEELAKLSSKIVLSPAEQALDDKTRRALLDRKLMTRMFEGEIDTKKTLTFMFGNRMISAFRKRFGKEAVEQLPHSLCALGKLWERNIFNTEVRLKWMGDGRKKTTPGYRRGPSETSEISVFTNESLQATVSPLYQKAQEELKQSFYPTRAASSDRGR